MAILTKNDFRQMSETQLGEKLTDLRKELMKMNTQISAGTTPESPGKVKEVKKVIARIITVLSLRKKTSKEKKVEKKPEEEKKKQ
ncbi:MAG: 50S ribosomal protein L29 [Nanoarchaeota archaeon]|nr:50S ribosomal protein L29 [Nanoarchaeota archaeon]